MTSDRKIVVWVLIFVVALLIVFSVKDVLLPFVAGIAIAYFLDPVADWLEARKFSRTLATLAITALFFAVVVLLLILILPLLQGQIIGFIGKIPEIANSVGEWLAPIQERLREQITAEQMSDLKNATKSFVGDAVKWVIGFVRELFRGGAAVFNALSLMLITPVVSFYLIRDYDLIVAKVDSWLPRDHVDEIRQVVGEIDRKIAGFVRGQGMVCLSLSAIYGIGLTAVGLDFGLLLGIATGLASFIPYFGMLIGIVTSVAIAVFQFSEIVSVVMVLAVFGIGQLVESFYLTPKLVGGQIGLHAVWVIFALMAGGALFGFTGFLLAVPVAATVGVLVRHFMDKYLESALYEGAGGQSSFSDEN